MFYGHALRPAWTPLHIILVLLAFWVAWPLGLALLVAFLFWGHHIRNLRSHFDGMCRNGAWSDWGRGPRGNGGGDWAGRGFSRSGNSAFDDYRDAASTKSAASSTTSAASSSNTSATSAAPATRTSSIASWPTARSAPSRRATRSTFDCR